MNSATRLRRVSPSSAVSMHSSSRGGILGFWNGRRTRANFFKEEVAEFKYKLNRCLRSSYHIVFGLKEYTRGIRLGNFPLGLRAPVLGMGTAQIPVNEPFPFLVGERMLLSPVRCLGSCSFHSHPAEAGQGSPHPAAQTPLRFFMSVFSVSLSLPISHCN